MVKNKFIASLVLSLLVTVNSVSTSYADSKQSKYYIKMVNTVSNISDIKANEPDLNYKLSQESRVSPAMGLGFGYHINDKFRVDMILEAAKFNFDKQASSFECNNGASLSIGTKSIQRKAYSKSLMFNGFADLAERNKHKIFIGAGIGAIRISEKITHTLSGNTLSALGTHTFPLLTENHTNKVRNKFAYSLMLGSSINVHPQVNIELMYSWKNLGKVKCSNFNSRYKGHHFSIASRFDI